MWTDYIHAAIRSLHPSAEPVRDYIWQSRASEDGTPLPPEMTYWHERLGPLNMAAIQTEAERLEAIGPPVPPITARQMRLWLLQQGVTGAMVEQAIAQTSDPAAREVARIEWEYATSFEHAHPLIQSLGAQLLGLTAPQIAAAFRQAALL